MFTASPSNDIPYLAMQGQLVGASGLVPQIPGLLKTFLRVVAS